MKVLHITPTYYPATYWGGPIFTVYHMNNALARIPGVELKVLTTDAAGPRVSERLSEAEKCLAFPYEVNFSRRIADQSISPGLIWKLLSFVRWADIVHLTYVYSFPTIPTLMLCGMCNKPVVWSLRGALLDDQARHLYAPQSALMRTLKAAWNWVCYRFIPPERVVLHVTGEQEMEASKKVYPGAHFVAIPNGVEVPKTLPPRRWWMPKGRLRLMYLGRLAPKKGVENLLQAVAKVDVPITLDVYGAGDGGYTKRLVTLSRDLGLSYPKVRFHGHVCGHAKVRAFLEADVCVVPSYSENFCVVVAEALSMGLPVIVSNRLAWDEVEAHGCGLVVGNDPDSLAVAIKKIRTMDLARMGKIGWTWMREEFAWDRIVKEMYELYRILSEKTRA